MPLSPIVAGEFGALLTKLTLPVTAPAAAGSNCTLKLLVCPDESVTGKANVPKVNPLPVTPICVTLNVPVPLFCNWIVWEAGDPTVTFPKLALAGVALNAGCRPLPETAMTAFAPCELATVMFPVTFSEALGLNVTFIDVFCPAANVTGVVIPVTLKSFALTLTCERVTLVFPLFEIVTLFEVELPAFTLVKLRLVGLADNVTDAAVPVPLRDNTLGEFGALLARLTVPARLPAVVGAKRTLNVVLLPEAIAAGVAKPLTV